MHKLINTIKAPEAVGPYSQALLVDDFLFCSGQLGIDPATNLLMADVQEQADQAMKNIGAVLHEANMDYSDIIKATIFLTEMSEFSKVNTLYESYLSKPYPARSCFAVKELPKGALAEIEVIAHKSNILNQMYSVL